jgi:hypothetical protein
MNTLVIVLRLLHIFAGVVWAGTTILFYFMIGPAVSATGDAGEDVHRILDHQGTLHDGHFSRGRHDRARRSDALDRLAGFTSAWMTSGAEIGLR